MKNPDMEICAVTESKMNETILKNKSNLFNIRSR